jgi:hypothetical protein
MITFRSPKKHEARSVIANTALRVGQFVVLMQGDAEGELPKVRKVVLADLTDPTKMIGLVSYIPENDLTTPYILNPVSRSLTVNEGEDGAMNIPQGALCVFWYSKPIVGFPQVAVDASLVIDTVREPTALAIDTDSAKLAPYDSANAKRNKVIGYVYMNDGAEITAILTGL